MRIRPGITMQRTFSLLDGKDRVNPIQPVRREPAMVSIGNRRLTARVEVAAQPTEDQKRVFAKAFAQGRHHTCAATEMGEFCGHTL